MSPFIFRFLGRVWCLFGVRWNQQTLSLQDQSSRLCTFGEFYVDSFYTFGLSSRTHSGWSPWLKVMLHGTIRNDDFKLNTALQYSNNVVTIRNHVTTMLQRCVAQKSSLRIVSCNITLTRADNPISQSVST